MSVGQRGGGVKGSAEVFTARSQHRGNLMQWLHKGRCGKLTDLALFSRIALSPGRCHKVLRREAKSADSSRMKWTRGEMGNRESGGGGCKRERG